MSKAAELANLIGNINAGGGGVNRNAIINGSMNVAQRGTSSTGIGASSGYFTCDRWLFAREAGTEQARFTMTQDTASVGIDSLPFQEAGIRTALKMDVTTAESAVAVGEASYIVQRIEGFNCSNLDIKTKPITLSFYAKSDTKTGTMCASLYASSGGRHHVKEYSITTDWQRFSLTFPADSSATALANDSSNELQVNFALTAGSNLQVTGDQWASGFDIATSNQINFADSTDNNWYITGVQLEVGQNPTEFEHEPYATTFEKCLRYFHAVVPKGVNIGYFAPAWYYSSSTMVSILDHKVEMRAAPTVESNDGTNDFRFYRAGTQDDFDDLSLSAPSSTKATAFYNSTDMSGTQGDAGGLYINDTTNAFFYLKAEL